MARQAPAQGTAAADYDLIYWPLPLRGQFIRAILAHAGKRWNEYDADFISALMEAPPARQLLPFKGPPVLVDNRTGFAVSQMPAIAIYLGSTLGLLPASAELRALTTKVVNDANDVIDEITLDGGREMWTRKKWALFQPRLEHWMRMWEALGTRHGLQEDWGCLLGTNSAGVADIVTATLWGTLAEHFPRIGDLLEATAPRTAALTRRMQATPALKDLRKTSKKLWGDEYCGGQIGKSLRKVAG